MWHTPLGERVLTRSEWELFRWGLRALWDQVERARHEPMLCCTGVTVFDRLQPESKLAMLALVGKALGDEDEPSPPLTSLTEGTFAAIYATILAEIEIEIDVRQEGPQPGVEEFSMRPFVLAAIRETNPEWENPHREPQSEDPEFEPPSLPQPECEDVDAWDDLLNELMDRVLWGDRDFEAEADFLDSDPRESQLMKQLMGIDRDYFSAIAPEPTDHQLTVIRKTLGRLCDRD
jgi:hypothetical protein